LPWAQLLSPWILPGARKWATKCVKLLFFSHKKNWWSSVLKSKLLFLFSKTRYCSRHRQKLET
jgi:hypothetical protein